MAVRYSNDPSAVPVKIKEEQVLQARYPLSYDALMKSCQERFKDFKPNNIFWAMKKSFENEPDFKYARPRYLNYETRRGTKKTYYSPEILKALDTYYIKK